MREAYNGKLENDSDLVKRKKKTERKGQRQGGAVKEIFPCWGHASMQEGGKEGQWEGGGANENSLQIITQEQSYKDMKTRSVPVSCVSQKECQEAKEQGRKVAKPLT